MQNIKIPSEHQEQKKLVSEIRKRYKDFLIFAIPNGGKRNRLEAVMLKNEGVLAGIPDLCILMPNNKVIFIEMKKRKGSNLSKAQKIIIPKIQNLGFNVIVGFGWEDALTKLEEKICETK